MRRNSMLNTTLTPKMIEFGRGTEMKDPVWWLGSNVRQWWSVQPKHWPAEDSSFLLIKWWNWTSRFIEITSLLVHCCPGHESTSKNVPVLFSRTLHHHMDPKNLRSGFQRMFRTLLTKRNEPNLPSIWILYILGSDHTLRARSRPFTVKVWKS